MSKAGSNCSSPSGSHSAAICDEKANALNWPNLKPIYREHLAQLDRRQSPELVGVQEARRQMRIGQNTRLSDLPLRIEIIENSPCDVHLIFPADTNAPLPILFYLHGGGWVLGGIDTHSYLISQLVQRAGIAVAFIEYPLAPEAKFPEPLEACLSAIECVLKKANSLGLDETAFAFAGDSSGGNLAAAATLLSKERHLPLPALQVLLYPVTDSSLATATYAHFGDHLNLTHSTMRWFWDQYAPDLKHRLLPTASPLAASQEQLKGLPPALVLTCEFDVLREEGEAYARKMIAAGNLVTSIRVPGVLHGFLVTESLAMSPSGQKSINLIASELRECFRLVSKL